MESSRIIIDPHTFNIYGAPSSGLGSIDSETTSQVDSTEDTLLDGVHNVIYKATGQAFKQYQNALGKHSQGLKEDIPGSCKYALLRYIRLYKNHV